jgi:hypothetical protein
MKRSTDRILTTHAGSMIRPPEVLALESESDETRRTAILRTGVAEVVRKQSEVGVDVVSDGEFGKSSWFSYIMERLEGYEVRPVERPTIGFLGRDEMRYPDFFQTSGMGQLGTQRHVCVAPIRYIGKPRDPADQVRYHVCWGSWPGPHTSDVPLRTIVDLILKINAQYAGVARRVKGGPSVVDDGISQPVSRRGFLGALGLGTGAVVLAACGGGAAPNTGPTAPGPASAATPATAASADQPKVGGTLTAAKLGDVANLDGHYWSPNGGLHVWMAYDTLARYDQDLKPQPQLAESWDVGSDFKQITVNLRKASPTIVDESSPPTMSCGICSAHSTQRSRLAFWGASSVRTRPSPRKTSTQWCCRPRNPGRQCSTCSTW